MTKEEVDQYLQFLSEEKDNVQINIFAILRDNSLKMLNIKDDDLPELKGLFINSINENIIQKEDYTIIPISTADERRNCFYEYDLEVPDELKRLQEVIINDNITNLNHRSDEIINIDSLIILLGTRDKQITLYKKIGPLEVLGRGGFVIKKAREMFERITENFLRISPSFSAFYLNQIVFIKDLSFIEKSFGFHEVIQREAGIGLNSISQIDIIENFNEFSKMVTSISFARKLTKISKDSPVLTKNIPNSEIIKFAKSNPALKGKFKFNEDESKFKLTSKVSKNLFLKLLNDDFLTSELTKLYYETLAKDGVTEDEKEN